MFETVELGRRVGRQAFNDEVLNLRTELLRAQFALQATDMSLVVVIGGVEGAGKGEVANRLSEWLDVRGLQTHAFRVKTDEELMRPSMWRYWRSLPARGQVGVYVRSWYTRPILEHATDRSDTTEFDRDLARIGRFEDMLVKDGTRIIKLWLHLPKKAQGKRLQKLRKRASTRWRVSKQDLELHRDYERFSGSAERAIRHTDSGPARWHLIEATQRRFRDLAVGQVLLSEMKSALRDENARAEEASPRLPPGPALSALPSLSLPSSPRESIARTVLDTVNLGHSIDPAAYKPALDALQEEVGRLAWLADSRGRSVVAVFEGWDAAGKGGCIRRLTRALDARLYTVHSIGAPTEEERAHHYLWRFWRHIPRAGRFTIYDRSWYGRVLVERVESFAREEEWQRAYHEINDFEEQLVEGGISVIKVFLHIDPDEQLRRFEERQEVAYKRHKITEEDWRNRGKWPEYEVAIDDMVRRTSTDVAPWHLVPANDKRFARIEVLRLVRDELYRTLGGANVNSA